MEGYISLSRREKYHYFFYLLLLLVVTVMLLWLVFLRNYTSPFSDDHAYELQMLEHKMKFAQMQKQMEPLLSTTFLKVNALPLKEIAPFAEADIKNDINEIASLIQNDKVSDPRIEAYYQVAQFYKMYFEDKKIAGKKCDNITLFEKQFTECNIGFKDKEQQLAQKKAAISLRNN